MRLAHSLTALSAGLVALSLGGAAAASGFVTRAGHFPAAGVAAGKPASNSALEIAAPAVAFAELRWSSGVAFGPARTVELATGERVVKLPQVHLGVPVAMRGLAVTFGADDAASLISASLEEDLPSSIVPAIPAEQAADTASALTGLGSAPGFAALVIWPTADGARLAWAIDPMPIPGLAYLPVVIVDAATGEVILRYDAAKTLNQAKAYPTNPNKSPALVDVTLPVGAGETTLQNALVKSRNCIDTKMAKPLNIMGFMITVHTCELLQTATPDANGDYLLPPGADTDAEDAFSEVSMFHHANRAYDFFHVFDAKLDVNPGQPLPTVSNLRIPQGIQKLDIGKMGDPNLPLDPFQNAFFSPANPLFAAIFPDIIGGAMWFGQGPKRDYSYDGDVIYHEFTHAVVNATLMLVGTPHMDELGASAAPGAMNEGLADYFSSAITGDPDVGEYAAKDFSVNLPYIRSLSSPDACPSAVGGEVHQDATMFSGSLWDARKALSAPQQAELDQAVFTAMNKSATGDLAYEDLAQLILEAVKVSPLGQPVADKLTAAFTARGLLPKCTRLLEYTGITMTGPKDLGGTWYAPGTQTTGVKSGDGWTPGIVTFHSKVDAAAARLTVLFGDVPVGGGGGILGMAGTPYKPKVLALFGKDPLKFTYKPLKAPPGAVLVDAETAGAGYLARVDVPAGASEVYVMIVNTGGLDGGYTDVTLQYGPADVMTTTGEGVGGGTATSSTGTGTGGTGPGDTEVGGCGCAIPGDDGAGSVAAVAALAAFGLAASRRRKRG